MHELFGLRRRMPERRNQRKVGTYVINPKKCTECIGYFDVPQCVAVCPVENTCVIDTSYPRYEARA